MDNKKLLEDLQEKARLEKELEMFKSEKEQMVGDQESVVKAWESMKEDMVKQLDKSKERNDTLSKECEDVKENLRKANEAIDELTKQKDRLSDENKAYESLRGDLDETIQGHVTCMAEKEQNVVELTTRVAELQQQLDETDKLKKDIE